MIILVISLGIPFLFIEIGQKEYVNQRLKYRQVVDELNSHIMDQSANDLPWTFSEYLKVQIATNVDNICPYYSSVASQQAGSKKINFSS